jgi:hypothetical protein
MALFRYLLISWLIVMLAGCPPKSDQKEISRERAIEIARARVNFKPKGVEAVKATEDSRPVWRVTFRGEPVSQVHLLGEVMVISVDRVTGEIVSIAKS